MAWHDKDNQELDDLLASSHIQDTWKSKEAQSKKKSIKLVILRDLLIILGVFGFIMFLVWNINNKDIINKGNHPIEIENDVISFSNQDEKQADTSRTCKELFGWRIESIDNDKPMILPRLKARFDEMHESDGVVTYEQSMPAFDSQFVSELSQKVTNPYEYYIRLNKMTWTFPDKSCNEDNKTQQELLFKTESSVFLYQSVVAYMKNYHASIKQGDDICITLTANRGDSHLTFRSVETTLKMDDQKKKSLSDYFANAIYRGNVPSAFYVDSFTTQWCYSIYNEAREIRAFYQQTPKSAAYPNVTISSMVWENDSLPKIGDDALYRSLIEKKMELVREDIGDCLSKYEFPRSWMIGRLEFDIPPSGGYIKLSKRGNGLFLDKNNENKEIIHISRCLQLGKVVPTLMNDIPIDSTDESILTVIFDINRPPKEEIPNITPKNKLWTINVPTNNDFESLYKLRMEKKLDAFSDELGACLYPYRDHRITAQFTFEVDPLGEFFKLMTIKPNSYHDHSSDIIFYDWTTNSNIKDIVMPCLEFGSFIPNPIHEIPDHSVPANKLTVIYEINASDEESANSEPMNNNSEFDLKAWGDEKKLEMLVKQQNPNDTMTPQEYAGIVKASLKDLNNKVKMACKPQSGNIRGKFKLDCAKGKIQMIDIKEGTLAQTMDSSCISEEMMKYSFSKATGAYANRKIDLPFAYHF